MVFPRTRYADPTKAGRHPFQVYLLLLCMVAGIPLVLGRTTAGSLEDLLPPPLVVAWGASLSIGAACAVIGAYWRGRRINGLTLERIGCIGVGSASVVYAVILLLFFHSTGIAAACIIGGLGAAAAKRSRDLGKAIRSPESTDVSLVDEVMREVQRRLDIPED